MSNSSVSPQQPSPSLPPLNTLIRPSHILSLFRQYEERKMYYFECCDQLWNAILTNPVQSPAYQNAYRKLVFLTQTIKDAMVRQKEKEKEAAREAERLASERSRVLQLQRQRAENERAAFQTLMQQVSSGEPIPSVADLEIGLSAFHNESTASIGLGLSEQDRTLTEDDVETALRLLNVSTKIASMEDIYAGLTLLGVSTCVRVDEYLQDIEKGRM